MIASYVYSYEALRILQLLINNIILLGPGSKLQCAIKFCLWYQQAHLLVHKISQLRSYLGKSFDPYLYSLKSGGNIATIVLHAT